MEQLPQNIIEGSPMDVLRLMTDITIANFVDSRTFTIIDKSNIYPEALSTSGNYYGMSYDMKIGFSYRENTGTADHHGETRN